MTIADVGRDEGKARLYNSKVLSAREAKEGLPGLSLNFPTSKSLQVLKLLLQNGYQKCVYSQPIHKGRRFERVKAALLKRVMTIAEQLAK